MKDYKLLVVVDMQKDFVTGPLGSDRSQDIVSRMSTFIKNFDGDVIFTKDTHDQKYLDTQEGQMLPIIHCLKGSPGHDLVPELQEFEAQWPVIEKPTFGSMQLCKEVQDHRYDHIYLVGVCTDICVLANAVLLKTADPEAVIHVLQDLCGGSTKDAHDCALKELASLQIDVQQSW